MFFQAKIRRNHTFNMAVFMHGYS